jgi:type II secretory pathway component PulM
MKVALATVEQVVQVAMPQHLDRLKSMLEAHPRQWADRFGKVGIVAVGLLVACLGFYASVLLPLDEAVDDASSRVKRLSAQVAQVSGAGPGGVTTVREQMGQFYRMFPRQGQLTDTVAKIFEAAAAQGISLQKGEYRVAEEADGHLRRFQIVLPIKADYPRIRRFLGKVAAEVPTAAIEHVQFERQKIADPQVEATIKLAVYLERKS